MRLLSGFRTVLPRTGAAAPPDAEATACRRAAAGLILLVFALNVAFLLWGCRYDLAPDEAHYWDWSRHLDWSYYSKGPLVAWLIRAGCELFGDLSLRITGSLTAAVRLPAAVCSALGLAGMYVLSAGVFRRERLALATVAALVTVTPFAMYGVFMTIDAPFLCCWTWATAFAHRAMVRGSRRAWLGVAIALGLGFMAKYTMTLFPAALILCWIAHREHRHHLRGTGMLALIAGGFLGGLPVLIWNARNDWTSFRHVYWLLGMADPAESAGGGLLSVVEFVGRQAGILLGYWFVAIVGGAIAFRPRVGSDPGPRLLWYLVAVPWGVCLAACAKRTPYANWPAPAYIAGFVLAMPWVARQVTSPSRWYRRVAIGSLAGVVVVGLTATVIARFPHLIRPALATLVEPPSESFRTPVRRYDPTIRLHGWRTLAAEVDKLREKVRRAEGREPLVCGSPWQVCGELGCYCDGHPEVYCMGRYFGLRYSQYDLWRPNPVNDPDAFAGRTFIYVGYLNDPFLALFERFSDAATVVHFEGGIPVNEWHVVVLHGFRAGAAKALPLKREY